ERVVQFLGGVERRCSGGAGVCFATDDAPAQARDCHFSKAHVRCNVSRTPKSNLLALEKSEAQIPWRIQSTTRVVLKFEELSRRYHSRTSHAFTAMNPNVTRLRQEFIKLVHQLQCSHAGRRDAYVDDRKLQKLQPWSLAELPFFDQTEFFGFFFCEQRNDYIQIIVFQRSNVVTQRFTATRTRKYG